MTINSSTLPVPCLWKKELEIRRSSFWTRCLAVRRVMTRAWSCLASPGIRYLYLAGLVLMFWLGTAGVTFAGETSKEFWPEIDLWWRLSPDWRLSMFVPISNNIETKYREGNLILQTDYAWGKVKTRFYFFRRRLLDGNRAQEMKPLLVRGGVLSGRSLKDRGQTYKESTIFIELHRRIPLSYSVLMSHRLRSDLRWIGDDPQFSTRWRYRLMVEKEFKIRGGSLVPYINVEPYYDSRYEMVNRVRLIGGASAGWSSHFALEGNITYQYDSKSSVNNLYALSLILHLFLETGGAR